MRPDPPFAALRVGMTRGGATRSFAALRMTRAHGARVEQRQDVGVAEAGGGGDLAQEALGAERGGELGAEDLDGDLAVVLEVVGEVDRGHAALAELALDAVAVGQRRGEAVEWAGRHASNSRTRCSAFASTRAKPGSSFSSARNGCRA